MKKSVERDGPHFGWKLATNRQISPVWHPLFIGLIPSPTAFSPALCARKSACPLCSSFISGGFFFSNGKRVFYLASLEGGDGISYTVGGAQKGEADAVEIFMVSKIESNLYGQLRRGHVGLWWLEATSL